jgi:hypothetical protein
MHASIGKTIVASLTLGAVAIALLWACGSTEEVKFGGPNALSKDKGPPTPGPGGGIGDGGLSAEASSCKPAGDGSCSVKWSTDLIPLFGEDGGWGCSKGGSCHGGVAAPFVNNNDPRQAYDQLRAYTVIRGPTRPYINPCSLDPNDSTFLCNMAPPGPNACGSPMPKGAPSLPADLQKLETWIRCGSPNN